MEKINIAPEDCYNMNVTLANVIAQHLRAFCENNVASPAGVDGEEWSGKLEQMAAAFETYAAQDGCLDESDKAWVKKGMALFIEHFNDLWY